MAEAKLDLENRANAQVPNTFKGATDNVDYSLTGAKGGFTKVSNYIMRHPVLNPTEKYVLSVLTNSAGVASIETVGAADSTHPLSTRMTVPALARYTTLPVSQVRHVVDNLVIFGLVVRDDASVGRSKVLMVVPKGPWPMLGDSPFGNAHWRGGIWKNQPELVARMTRMWRSAVLKGHVTPENGEEALRTLITSGGKTIRPDEPETPEILKSTRTNRVRERDLVLGTVPPGGTY